MNLFLATRQLTDRKEDHLTEFVAGALELDDVFRDAYATLVLDDYARRAGWGRPEIKGVATQGTYDEFSSRPDMILTLRDGHIIAVEHKLEAAETMVALDKEAEDEIPQLERYLRLPDVDAIAFVRTTLKPPSPSVLEHAKYIRPSNRQHFLWRDFFPLLESTSHPYSRWLLEGFAWMGFTPPHPQVGDLTLTANRENFAKLWGSTRARAHELGWKVGAGDVYELYFTPERAKSARQVWASPRAERLLVRISPESEEAGRQVAVRLAARAGELGVTPSIEVRSVRRGAERSDVVEVWAPMRKVLEGAGTADEIERRLAAFVVPVLEAVDG